MSTASALVPAPVSRASTSAQHQLPCQKPCRNKTGELEPDVDISASRCGLRSCVLMFHGARTDSNQPIITASVTGAVVDSAQVMPGGRDHGYFQVCPWGVVLRFRALH